VKIAIIGTGYVGLVSGLCLAKIGHFVFCIDKDENKIARLSRGEIPIYEPGLSELLFEMKKLQRISFSTNLLAALNYCEALFIAVGTPQNEQGEADLSGVFEVVNEILALAESQNLLSLKMIVVKSTVPPGTGKKIAEILQKSCKDKFLLASNPEFLREGQAINDFMNPDLILLGGDKEEAKSFLSEIYQQFSVERIFKTDIATAELVKYGINSFLATKICFINEMADLCEKTGAKIGDLAKAIGQDKRIGDKFLNPGPGFGGSCFPKDVSALLAVAKNNKTKLAVVESVSLANEQRIDLMVEKISKAAKRNLEGCKIAVLGLAFKGGTDDVRCSPAMKIIKALVVKKAKVFAHDFCAVDNAKHEFQLANISDVNCSKDYLEVIKDADLLVVATEWPQYRELDFVKIKALMSKKIIVDLRNILPREKLVELGFKVYFVGGEVG